MITVGQSRAESVLLAILDGTAVEVTEIEAALTEVRMPAPPVEPAGLPRAWKVVLQQLVAADKGMEQFV